MGWEEDSDNKEILFHNGGQRREDLRLLRTVRRFWLNLLLFLDLFCAVFPKDSIYEFRFETKKIIKLPINRRSLGMQYTGATHIMVFLHLDIQKYLGDKKQISCFTKRYRGRY